MAIDADPTLLGKGLEWVGAIAVGLIGVVWKMLHSQIETLHKHGSEATRANALEIDRQRDNIAKLFDKFQAFSERAEARHLELLNAMHSGLNSKADK